MIFNEEQWNIIKKASPHYETAKRDFIRNATRKMTEDIVGVYEAATGKTVPNKDSHCSVCVLRIYQIIGKAYFADLKERQKMEDEKKAEEKAKDEEKPKPKINSKKGRKKTNK